MRRHALDVFHEGGRILENEVVDALQNIANARVAALIELENSTQLGVIDMAAAVRSRVTS
jgi:hypothetical protein